jgi:hypothetical protein
MEEDCVARLRVDPVDVLDGDDAAGAEVALGDVGEEPASANTSSPASRPRKQSHA